MLRRDFLVGTAASSVLLALSPPLFCGPETYQDSIRRRAAMSNEVLLCWGMRSGKNWVASRILTDALASSTRYLEIEIVSTQKTRLVEDALWTQETIEATTALARMRSISVAPNFWISHRSPAEFLELSRQLSADLVLIDEIDWAGVSPSQLLDVARTRATKVVAWSSPRVRHGGFLDLVLNRQGAPGVVADHAATWEVNPLITKQSLAYLAHHPSWERDFAAYRHV